MYSPMMAISIQAPTQPSITLHQLIITMSFHPEFNVNKEIYRYLEGIYEILIDLEDIREVGQRNGNNAHSASSIRSIQNYRKIQESLLSTMAFSSDDSTCAPTSIPTPNEFSRLMGDEDANELVTCRREQTKTNKCTRGFKQA